LATAVTITPITNDRTNKKNNCLGDGEEKNPGKEITGLMFFEHQLRNRDR
jgi:hypothetical protein